MTRKSLAVGAGLAAAVAVWVLWPRGEPGPHVQIERRVVEMTDAAEKKDVAAVLEGVSERFRGAEGWSKEQLRGVLVGQLLRGQWVRLFLTQLDVQVLSATQGKVSGTFLFTRAHVARPEELSLRSVAEAWKVEGEVEREADGEWRFIRARHERAHLQELLLP